MTAINVFATLCGVYGDSSFRFDRVYIYTAAITNISQVSFTPAAPLKLKLCFIKFCKCSNNYVSIINFHAEEQTALYRSYMVRTLNGVKNWPQLGSVQESCQFVIMNIVSDSEAVFLAVLGLVLFSPDVYSLPRRASTHQAPLQIFGG